MIANIPSQYLVVGSTVMAIIMGSIIMIARMRSQKKPVNPKKLLIPPVAMSTGALMFIFEEFRLAPLQILEAVSIGVVFSIVLIATSKFEVRGQEIYMKRSKAFFFILIGILIGRIVLKVYLSESFEVGELGGMFWTLAFAMLWPWRIAMLLQYNKIRKTQLMK
ncbi:MAG TPA: cytochrome c biogenesis protein CcdC [Ureibacillus sp.]|nr:cytochrome c biogenesis protein CcdC [Ureibacillus sp.]